MRTLLQTVCYFLLSAQFLVGFPPGAATAEEPIFELHTDEHIDEQLYLVRRLEGLHAVFSTDTSDPDALAAELLKTRYEMARIKEYAQLKSMDTRLAQLYSDSLELLDQYSKLLIDVGAIDREFERRLGEHSVSGFARAVTDSIGTGGGLAMIGVDPYTAGAAIVGLMVEKGYAAHQERRQLQDERDSTKLNRVHDFDVERTRLLGRIQVQVGILAEKLHWAPAEVGFDTTDEEAERIQSALIREDMSAIHGHLEIAQKLRPRDPFVFAGLAEMQTIEFLRVCDDDGDAKRLSHLKQAMEHQVRAAQLVPKDRFHDPIRAEYLRQASMHASTAAYFAGKQSDLPLRLANAALHYQPRDPSGLIRWTRAVALHRNRDFERAVEAFEQVGRMNGQDAGYHFDLACVLSSANRPGDAMRHLQLAWNAGRRDVREVRRHHDLEILRREFQHDVHTLIAPKWTGSISYGHLWNDCVIENRSACELNNAAIKVTCSEADGAEFVEVYWVDSLPSTSSHTVSSTFDTVYDDSKNRVITEILCDENRALAPTRISDAVGTYQGDATLIRTDGKYAYDSMDQRLTIALEPSGTLAAEFETAAGPIRFSIGPIRDSHAILTSPGESAPRGGIWFSGSAAYGWYQPSAQESQKYAFWLDR